MIELTLKQQAAVAEEEGRFVNDYHQHVMEIFGRDGWDDPTMDVYNELDPRVNP